MITNNRIEGKKSSGLMLPPQLKTVGILEAFPCVRNVPVSHRTLHCQVSDLQQGGSSDQELQKQRASHRKQSATSVSNLSCMWRESALQKPVPKSKQRCPRKSILAGGQERSPRSE
ncbi:hypothetical protein Tco_0239954, partial [Tanacetum coccineum]